VFAEMRQNIYCRNNGYRGHGGPYPRSFLAQETTDARNAISARSDCTKDLYVQIHWY